MVKLPLYPIEDGKMSLTIQKFREIVFQILFSEDVCPTQDQGIIHLLMAKVKVSKKSIHLAYEKVAKLKSMVERFDLMIEQSAQEYQFDRITRVEKNIIRLMLFEIFKEDLPHKVGISEGIRLARKFGTPESGSFVNAILDSCCKITH